MPVGRSRSRLNHPMGALYSKPMKGIINDVVTPSRRGEIENILADHALIRYYHNILRSLDLSETQRQPRTIAVTASLYDEGAPNVALGLATTLAELPAGRVILADLDLRRPSLDRILEAPTAPGVSEIISQRVPLEDALQRTVLPNLAFLPAGVAAQYGLAAGVSIRDWLTRFVPPSDVAFVVLHLPPLNVDVGSALLAAAADSVILVVRSNATPRSEIEAALTRLSRCHLASIVVNHGRSPRSSGLSRLLRSLRGAKA